MRSIIWNKEYNVPEIINQTVGKKSLCSDLRPVFLYEKKLISVIMPEYGDEILEKSVWNGSNNSYYIDGTRVKGSIYSNFLECDLNYIIKELKNFKPSEEQLKKEQDLFDKFVAINHNHYIDLLENEKIDGDGLKIGAFPFIKQVVNTNKNRVPVVSFSGGKDSTVVSELVRTALGKNEVLHINSDTTIEFPTTYEYIRKFKEENDNIPFFIESISQTSGTSNFFDLCKLIGPPSRVKNWCCSIFKTGPMGNAFANMDENWLTFYGIRRSESASRSKYKKLTKSPKLAKQIVASPIIDWLDIDIWLHLLTNKSKFNIAYKQGFSRVGCWCCPNNSLWSDILMSIYNNEEYMKWHNFLIEFAKSIGKKDYDVYVGTGKWKARQGGSGITGKLMQKSYLKFKKIDMSTKIYYISKIVIYDKIAELFKPFGKIEKNIGVKSSHEFQVISKNNEQIFNINIFENEVTVKVINNHLDKIYNRNKMQYSIWSYIDRQITKYQVCINCQACMSTCPTGALKVTNDSYVINQELCINCLNCVMHYPKGCLIASALSVRKSEEI